MLYAYRYWHKRFDPQVLRKNEVQSDEQSMSNLLRQSHERVPGGVDQDTAVVDAEEAPFDLEEDVVVDVGDDEAAVRQGHHFPHDRKVQHLRNAVLGSDYRRRLRHLANRLRHHSVFVCVREREMCFEADSDESGPMRVQDPFYSCEKEYDQASGRATARFAPQILPKKPDDLLVPVS